MMQDTHSSPISNEKGAKNNYTLHKLLIIIFLQNNNPQKNIPVLEIDVS
jgi:hypothetical protein